MINALVLIVEDEPEIAEILDAYFQRGGFRTVRAANGEIALALHLAMAPDLVVLDVKLPKKDGFAVLAELRARGTTPVIMATALGDDLEKISALRVGADDYIVKPCNPLEVVARAHAVLRRTNASSTHPVLRAGVVEVDLAAHVVRLVEASRACALDLTLTEFRLLAHMARTPRRAFTRAELLDACLPADSEALERTVDSHLSKLRRKLEAAGAIGFLEGVRGIGYRLEALK